MASELSCRLFLRYVDIMEMKKLFRWIEKLWYEPIEVFVFHAVTDEFDERVNKRIDWSQTEEFESHILQLKERYTFISLEEAYIKLRKQWCRRKRYAVLTCDDGYASVLEVLPFLERERVPLTLFINPKYLDGVSRREGYAECPQYISHEQLWALNGSLITVGMHGYGHDDATKQSVLEFEESVDKCIEILQSHPRYIPFFAYTWGRYSNKTQQQLVLRGIVPVLTDGEPNYRYRNGIGRKPIDSRYWGNVLKKL